MADTLNLDSRTYRDRDYNGRRAGNKLFRDALADVKRRHRQHRPVRKLSVLADSHYQNDYIRDIMSVSPGMDALLAAPALRCLEELRAEFLQIGDEYVLPASRLPAQSSLRVLDLYGCTLGPPGAFRRLETLKMVYCITSVEGLQAMLDASPRLHRLWLETITFTAPAGQHWHDVMSKRRVLLRCPEATASVTVIHCHRTAGLDVDAPSARSLRFTGFLEHFPFGSPVDLQHAELSFCREKGMQRCFNPPSTEAPPPHAVFWESIGRFRRLRVLKLELLHISDIAAGEEGVPFSDALFPDLVILELEGSHEADSHGAAVAIANLLWCCPALQEFQLKCKGGGDDNNLDAFGRPRTHLSDERSARLGLDKSMESLKRLKSGNISCSFPGVGDDADIAALKACSFPCLNTHLRKMRLEFELKCFDCFQVRLAKFFVENAHVLEEMEVHDGHQRVSDHIHRNLPIWRANSSKSKIKVVGERSIGSSM